MRDAPGPEKVVVHVAVDPAIFGPARMKGEQFIRQTPTLILTPATARILLVILRLAGPAMSKHRLGWYKVGVSNGDLKTVTSWIRDTTAVCRKVIDGE